MIPDDEILQRIKFIVLQQDPEAKIFLYGSRAKGTAQTNSDWDLLILLKKDGITYEMEQNIT